MIYTTLPPKNGYIKAYIFYTHFVLLPEDGIKLEGRRKVYKKNPKRATLLYKYYD